MKKFTKDFFRNSICLIKSRFCASLKFERSLKISWSLFTWVTLVSTCEGFSSGELLEKFENQCILESECSLSKHLFLEGWFDDFSTAQQIALKHKKFLLIAFLGPSWCPWSDKLEAEILVDKTFIEGVKKEVVLLKVDLPQDFEKSSSKDNSFLHLKQRYQIQECPTLVLAQSTGEEIAKLKYLPLNSREYVTYVKEVLLDFNNMLYATKEHYFKLLQVEEIKKLYAKAGKFADQTFKRMLLEKGLKEDQGTYFLLEQYGQFLSDRGIQNKKTEKLRKKILERDPKNEDGVRLKLAIMDFESLASVTQSLHTSDTVVKPLIDYLKQYGKQDVENAWKLEMKISQYLYGKDQVSSALDHAKASYAIAPEKEKKDIAESIEYLQTHLTSP